MWTQNCFEQIWQVLFFKMGAAIFWNGITNGHLKESKDITTYYNQKK